MRGLEGRQSQRLKDAKTLRDVFSLGIILFEMQHPVWYRGMLSYGEYWSGNYRAAIDEAVRTNAPYLFWLQIVLAAANWANNSRRLRPFAR